MQIADITYYIDISHLRIYDWIIFLLRLSLNDQHRAAALNLPSGSILRLPRTHKGDLDVKGRLHWLSTSNLLRIPSHLSALTGGSCGDTSVTDPNSNNIPHDCANALTGPSGTNVPDTGEPVVNVAPAHDSYRQHRLTARFVVWAAEGASTMLLYARRAKKVSSCC